MSCSDSGSDEMPLGAQGDLASRTLVLESKRFYLDVKENKRGRFIKIAEISADGRKENTIIFYPEIIASILEPNIDDFLHRGSV